MDEVKKPFWQWAFCEADGTASFARIGTGMLLAATIGWDTAYIVLSWMWNTHHLAAGQPPMPILPTWPELVGQVGFFTGLYGTNRFFTRRSEQ